MDTFRERILSGSSPPLLLKNQISDWSASSWTPEYLANELKDYQLRCKVAPKDIDVLWETECIHEEITLHDFVDWSHDNPGTDNPLKNYDRNVFSCYIDYKYMKDVFCDRMDLLKAVDWSKFGLENRGGNDSTIWIGSEGCYTNCHYDTYGFNLVAQTYGRKRWILFPPSDTGNLYPTRIPYEESSVFSQVNVRCPDLLRYNRYKLCQPHVITLEPGDVLFVPRHWWHFVECMDTAISINTWVEMEEDRESHIDEAITRLLFRCLIDMKIEPCSEWINPGEEIQGHDVNFKYLQETVKHLEENDRDSKYSKKAISNTEKFASYIESLQNVTSSVCLNDENIEPQNTKPSKVHRSNVDSGACSVKNIASDMHTLDRDSTGQRSRALNRTEETITTSLKKRKNVAGSCLNEKKKQKLCSFKDMKCIVHSGLPNNECSVHVIKPVSFEVYMSILSEDYDTNEEDSVDLHVCDGCEEKSVIQHQHFLTHLSQGSLSNNKNRDAFSQVSEEVEISDRKDLENRTKPVNKELFGESNRKECSAEDTQSLLVEVESESICKSTFQSICCLKRISDNGKAMIEKELNFEDFSRCLLHQEVIQKIREVLQMR